jgi:C1A family cysteine protease
VDHGPLSVCIDADSWQNYNGGIITADWDCGDSIDHCGQLVGYGLTTITNGTMYWIVRNCWGTNFGIDGYVWIQMGQDICAIADEVSWAVV